MLAMCWVQAQNPLMGSFKIQWAESVDPTSDRELVNMIYLSQSILQAGFGERDCRKRG